MRVVEQPTDSISGASTAMQTPKTGQILKASVHVCGIDLQINAIHRRDLTVESPDNTILSASSYWEEICP